MHRCIIAGKEVGRGSPVRLMGVVNCSPESFYHGSYAPHEMVRNAACAMSDQGADIIDIGARSTAPGSPLLQDGVERDRLVAALRTLEGSGVPVSIDTTSADVLISCSRYDLAAVNDISGLSAPGMGEAVRDIGLPVVLMASRERPGDSRTLMEVRSAAGETLARAERWGLDEVVLDPGIGLWTPERTTALDWGISRNFSDFMEFSRPLLAAVSRKTFLGELTKRPVEYRLAASLALTVHLVLFGADMVRTHDVAETQDLIAVCDALKGTGP
jgi:dihydropteroate synthase